MKIFSDFINPPMKIFILLIVLIFLFIFRFLFLNAKFYKWRILAMGYYVQLRVFILLHQFTPNRHYLILNRTN